MPHASSEVTQQRMENVLDMLRELGYVYEKLGDRYVRVSKQPFSIPLPDGFRAVRVGSGGVAVQVWGLLAGKGRWITLRGPVPLKRYEAKLCERLNSWR